MTPRQPDSKLRYRDEQLTGEQVLNPNEESEPPPNQKTLVWDDAQQRFYEHAQQQQQSQPYALPLNQAHDLPLDVLYERLWDTAEDALLHAKRIPYDKGWIQEDEPPTNIPTVVVLGSGWAAHALLKVADTQQMRIVVVSPTNHFVFTPMLASASVGTVEYRSMTEAVRAANPMIQAYWQGTALDVDPIQQTVQVQLSEFLGDAPTNVTIHYDHLVVAVGCKVNDRLVPGADQYALRLKSCEDARQLRNAIGECLESACRPVDRPDERRRRVTFGIVGGGPTGIELAGELSDFIQDVTVPRVGSYASLKDDIRVVLIHGGSELVPQFDKELRKHALETLRKGGVEVRLETRVQEVGDGFLRLLDKNTGEESTLETGVTVWAAGTGPVPFIDTLLEKLPEEARGEGGKVTVDQWLRCPTPTPEAFGSILVLGDAAHFADGPNSALPQTAQVAGQQGAYVARLLNRGHDLTSTPPRLEAPSAWMQWRKLEDAPGFSFLNLGLLAYLGGGQALSQIQLGDVPIAQYAGSISFALWRSVYLVKQVATRNRVLVTFDWMKSAIFGRDITRL